MMDLNATRFILATAKVENAQYGMLIFFKMPRSLCSTKHMIEKVSILKSEVQDREVKSVRLLFEYISDVILAHRLC
jgi:hypothetical protein